MWELFKKFRSIEFNFLLYQVQDIIEEFLTKFSSASAFSALFSLFGLSWPITLEAIDSIFHFLFQIIEIRLLYLLTFFFIFLFYHIKYKRLLWYWGNYLRYLWNFFLHFWLFFLHFWFFLFHFFLDNLSNFKCLRNLFWGFSFLSINFSSLIFKSFMNFLLYFSVLRLWKLIFFVNPDHFCRISFHLLFWVLVNSIKEVLESRILGFFIPLWLFHDFYHWLLVFVLLLRFVKIFTIFHNIAFAIL